MSDFITPSKDDLKKKYEISNDDFEILTVNTAPIPKPGELLEPVAKWHETVATYLFRRGKGGRVAAVLFLVPAILKTAENGIDTYVSFPGKVASWVRPFQNLPEPTLVNPL